MTPGPSEPPSGDLSYERRSVDPVDRVLPRLRDELARRGFGVLAALPVHDLLRERGGATLDPIVILEVCSPPDAVRALSIDRRSALLLPCKLVLTAEGPGSRVSLLRPSVALARLMPDPRLEPVGAQVERTLIEVVDAATRPPRAP